MLNKKRILVLGDTGTCATGFGTLLRNVLFQLAQNPEYEITQIGINYDGDFYDREKFPYKIYPAAPMGQGDLYGLQRLLITLSGNDKSILPPFDIVFTVQDHFILEQIANQLKELQEKYKEQNIKSFKWVSYFPVDSELKENWISTILKPDYPVVYTDYAINECKKYDYIFSDINRIQKIYHGVNTKDFYCLPQDEKIENRKKIFHGIENIEKKFIVMNINRNQERKDIMRSMMVFKEFKKYVPQAFYYLHVAAQDVGGNINEMARELNLKIGEDYAYPNNFNANQGFPVEILNRIYNCADMLITTTLGEGWGFSLTEAMAARVLCVGPNITSIPEIFNSQNINTIQEIENSQSIRGIPVISGKTLTEYIYLGHDHERKRPLVNIEDMVEKMKWCYYNQDKTKPIIERAYNWVQKISWENIGQQWGYLFKKIIEDIEK